MMQVEVDCPDELGKGTSETPEKSQNRECNEPSEMTGPAPESPPNPFPATRSDSNTENGRKGVPTDSRIGEIRGMPAFSGQNPARFEKTAAFRGFFKSP